MKKPSLIILSSALVTGAVIKAAPALAEPVNSDVSVVQHRRPRSVDQLPDGSALDHRLVLRSTKSAGPRRTSTSRARTRCGSAGPMLVGKARARGEQLASRGEGIVVASR